MSVPCGQILLQNFQNPDALIAQGWRHYSWSQDAGPLPQPTPPGQTGNGFLATNSLEQAIPKLQLTKISSPQGSLTQGVLVPTAIPTDLGIEGPGFFVLRRTNDNALFATRVGAFYADAAGWLVHYSGLRLQGYTNEARIGKGDLRLDAFATVPPGATSPFIGDFAFGMDGSLVESVGGEAVLKGQALLAACANPASLSSGPFALYPMETNGNVWSPLAPERTAGLGWLVPGALEVSQCDSAILAVRGTLNFFSQGSIIATTNPSNLALLQTGFFTLRDPVANILYATRWGAFALDDSGHLVASNGWRVQGFTNSSFSQIGDLVIDPGGSPDSSLTMTNYQFTQQGEIVVSLSDGSSFVRGQVIAQAYGNLQALRPIGNSCYSNLSAALPLSPTGLPYCYVVSGALEQIPPPPPALQLPPVSGLRLYMTDLNNGMVESSTDLIHWQQISEVFGSPDLNIGEFFVSPSGPQTFYRVLTLSNPY